MKIQCLDLLVTVVVDIAHSASNILGVGHRRRNGGRRAVMLKLESLLTCHSVRQDDIW